jgi:hypothetical protein
VADARPARRHQSAPARGHAPSHDMRSQHIEAISKTILAAIGAQKDISSLELANLLWTRRRHAVSFAASTIWRFLERHAIT